MKIPPNSGKPLTHPSLLPIHSCTSSINMSPPNLLENDPAIDTTYDLPFKILSSVALFISMCFLAFLLFVDSKSSCRLVKVKEALLTSILLAWLACLFGSFTRQIPRSLPQLIPRLWEILQLELSIILVLLFTAACPAVCGC